MVVLANRTTRVISLGSGNVVYFLLETGIVVVCHGDHLVPRLRQQLSVLRISNLFYFDFYDIKKEMIARTVFSFEFYFRG